MFTLNTPKAFNKCNPTLPALFRNHEFNRPFMKNVIFSGLFKTNNIRTLYLIRNNRFKLLKFLSFKLENLSCYFKEQTISVVKACSEQCEFVLAHRIRRGQQIFSLYLKWWGQTRLIVLIHQLKLCLNKPKYIGYCLCSAPLFNWDSERIPDDELLRLQDELDRVKRLMNGANENYVNSTDQNRSYNVTDVPSCTCSRCLNDTEEEWVLFYSNHFIYIWRKEHSDHKGEGVYVYKVYGHFDDITAEDFFQVQIDTDFRKEWDTNSVQLFVIDSEPQTNSDILYWEFQFPKMFCNRDYVCNRRFTIDKDNKVIIIVNESVNHPKFPENPSLYRVKEYWSHMVIKPQIDFTKPGVEFCITYFDNPGLILPSYVTCWYTITGMPEYLLKQRDAAKSLAERRNVINRETENDVICKYNFKSINEDKLPSNKSENNISTASNNTSFPAHQREKRFMLI